MSSQDAVPRPGSAYATDRYLPVFLILVALLALVSFIDEYRAARVLAGLGVVAAILGTLQATGTEPRMMRRTGVAAALLAAGVVTEGVATTTVVTVVVNGALASMLGYAAFTLLRRVFEQTRISPREVIAALTAYVELALAFAFLYGAAAAPVTGFFTNGEDGTLGDFVYFSVVTITTLGYGDLAPATSFGRSLVMMETLFGQIFLVVLVAFLVGRMRPSRFRVARGDATGGRPGSPPQGHTPGD